MVFSICLGQFGGGDHADHHITDAEMYRSVACSNLGAGFDSHRLWIHTAGGGWADVACENSMEFYRVSELTPPFGPDCQSRGRSVTLQMIRSIFWLSQLNKTKKS